MQPQSKKEERIERREQVWQMRVVDRLTYREIAKKLGITVWTAYQDAKWLADHRIKALEGKDKELIATQNEIYEALLNKWMPVALGEPTITEDGDSLEASHQEQMYATDRVTKILQDQAKLFGFHTLPRAGEGGQAKELGAGIAEGVITAMAKLADASKDKVLEAEVVEVPQVTDASQDI
jgi:transposase